MNKTALRNFAVQTRVKLLEAVKQKAYKFGITAGEIKPLEEGIVVNGRVLGEVELKQYQKLIKTIAAEGYERVMEEAAYTWFNRLIALRYMEVNDFLPIHMRILSSEAEGKNEPDALTNIISLIDELDLDREFVYQMQDDSNYNDLYQYLLIQQSNKLGEIIPNVFEYISDEMALLLPDNLLNENSVLRDVITMVDEEDWNNVEVVGWLYQFYISEQKDAAFKNTRKKFGKEEIGPVTQLFTPRWIVEYMVDNSLGRLWLESYPDKELQESMEYYLEDAEQTDEVKEQLEALRDANLDIESIKFIDPSCGSGHILVYAFELFYKIYLSRGYLERDIPSLILENNLYGLDIDTRATQLASFALVMKAREYDRRLFTRDYTVHVHSIEESNSISEDELKTFAKGNKEVYSETEKLMKTFDDGKLYGSIIKLSEVNIELIEEQIAYLKEEATVDLFTTGLLDFTIPLFESLIDQYHTLNQKYEVVVTNPPYMGSGRMDPKLSKYVRKHYPAGRRDLFAVFIEATKSLTKKQYYTGIITQHTWMFLSSYEKLRENLLETGTIKNMIHLGTNTFEEISGEMVSSTSFIIQNKYIEDYTTKYIRLTEVNSSSGKRREFRNKDYYYENTIAKYYDIPETPIAYEASENIIKKFSEGKILGNISNPRQGLASGKNPYFYRYWQEVQFEEINKEAIDIKDFLSSEKLYAPVNKGGGYRKWYGNNYEVIKFNTENYKLLLESGNNLPSRDKYFLPGITWGKVSTSNFSCRYSPVGFIFTDAGMKITGSNEEDLKYIGALLLSKVCGPFFKIFSESANYETGNISKMPVIFKKEKLVLRMSNINIDLSKSDWDSFEESWDFKIHPFLQYKEGSSLVEDSYNKWAEEAENRFNQLKENEEELNRIFIDIYGLEDELTPEVEDKDVTVRKADRERDVKSFLSYLVGVIFGRYSLDEEGLVYAGGEWDSARYKTFKPVEDNIVPMTVDGYFEKDIVDEIESLLKIIYGEESLEENIAFIADALKKRKNETEQERIRRYFTNEFFKDHTRIYKKCPIYWEFSSGRRGAFKGLMYLHRYQSDAVARLRTDYLLKESQTLDNLTMLEEYIIRDENSSSVQKARAEKVIENYRKDQVEIAEYTELLDHVAQRQIELDLDDGVKVNYEKFQKIEVVDSHTAKKKKKNVLSTI